MRIEQLIAFDKVVQHSSFTKAANELYKSLFHRFHDLL